MILLPIHKAKLSNTASFLLSSTSDKKITILQNRAINFFLSISTQFQLFSHDSFLKIEPILQF